MPTAYATEVELDYKKFADRFVTTVKEAQVEADFLQVEQVKSCLQEITAEDLKGDQAALKEKQAKSANCVRQKMEAIAESNPDQLTALAEKLQLDAFGVIKGKSSREVIDFFSSRLENALYGKGPDGKPARLKDQKIVDQKVFADIYETQLGKNILLEISQYCQGRIRKSGGNPDTRFDAIAAISSGASALNLADWTDLEDRSNLSAETNIYSDFVSKVLGTGLASDPEAVKVKLTKIFNNCMAMISQMCEQYQGCLCKYKTANPPTDGTAVDCVASTNLTCANENGEPKIGQHSCHVMARLRGYRTNLTAVKETQKQFLEMNGGVALARKDTYKGKEAQAGESIDDLTSLSSKDVELAMKESSIQQESDEFERAACEKNPESPDCEKFFYREDEVLKFANSSVGYAAATAVESAKITALAKESDKLKDYLKLKGYFDLAAQVDTGNTEEIIKAAKQRFETEREATFKEMSAAFDRKQIVTGTDQQKSERVKETKSEIKNRGKSFQQLMLFNNVVTSYLSLSKKDQNDKEIDAGTNVKALQREVQGMGKVAEASSSLKYFSSLATGESSVGADENPLVNIEFLDSILGRKKDQDTSEGANPSNPSGIR